MSRCGLPVLTPGSSAAMGRSNGRFDDQKTEIRRHPSFGAQQKAKQRRECHRFARPPQLALPTVQYFPKTSPLFTLPLRWKEQAGTPRSGRGGPSVAMSSIVPAATGRRPRGCEKLPCTCRACHFQQRYRPRPTVSGLNFLAVEIVPSTPCNSSKVRELEASPPSGPPSHDVGRLPVRARSQNSGSAVKLMAG